jgi:hypothetical protein
MTIQREAATLAANATAAHPDGNTIAELRRPLSQLPEATRIRQQLDAPSRRGADLRVALLEAVDVLIADGLLSLSYAVALRDLAGRTRLDHELPRRHDFGLTLRTRTAWSLPHLLFLPGQPWRVRGSALGLDVGLAPLALRKIDSAPPGLEPRILSTHRYSFVLSAGLLDEFALGDAEAGAIAQAIARGERRVGALTAGSAPAVVDEIGMDGWRARALRWSVAHTPDRVPSLFSQTELLYLGGGGHLNVHPWGMAALVTLGCLCTVLPPPGLNTALVGRHQIAVLPAAVPDLNLRVAVLLHELQMPAALAKPVLDVALYDLLADVRPLHTDDWLTVVRRARALSRERVEDALAAVTASAGPLSLVRSARRLQ